MRTGLWVCFSLLMVMSVSVSAQNMGRGKVDFGGEIVEVPCGLDTASRNQVVSFGEVSLQNSTKLRQPVAVKLVDCTLASKVRPGYKYHAANITFYGDADEQDPSLLALKGDAKGLSLHILNDELQKIGLGDTKHDYEIVEGDNTLRFITELKIDQNRMRAGNFSATLQFVLSYF